ncbi:glycosyltransferase family 2 protein [Turneriella parva]|uniref:Glycosyl transferase family 2 n=1 Tax=Turneriella parva (strain ATCC BAA-1111 / DSM 21527 / NCTC 11395 / H) TaxID=869212 RepID=I4BBQ6_TURPD|nr:glycosyltransferase family 2 protein [Turneriella parva]AFM14713.1 glycosyl transferase family 2 [Turneriella parva DSM 21527]
MSAAVVITYNPDREIVGRLMAIRRECGKVYVIDNGSEPASLKALRQAAKKARVQLVELGENTGIAHAQNVGLERAFTAGAEGVLLFDHDSVPTAGYAQAMRSAYTGLRARLGSPVILGGRVFDVNKREFARHPVYTRFGFSRRTVGPGKILGPALMVIASGSYVSREIYERVGGMREDFFIDYVDWEFCLRAKEQGGFQTYITGDAVLEHARGVRTGRRVFRFVVYPPGYSVFRYGFIFRNRARMLREYCFKNRAFVFFEFASLARDVLLLFAEPRPWRLLVIAGRAWFRGLFWRAAKPVVK